MLAKRYRIQEPIGSGGYASVYRAIDERSGQECAVKEVVDADHAVREQFRLEAELLIRAPHYNIPKGYELFEERGRMYLVMEYIRGKDLEELLNDSLVNRGRALDEAQVLRWMIKICDALIAMHHQPIPIIHRDIKPANIKITRDGSEDPEGRPVLIDFGLAKQQRAGNPTMTAAQGVSPGFAPPEQYMAKGKTDARTDVYALGATLYACLTGQDPPDAPSRLLAQTGARGNGGAALQPVRKRNPRVSEATDRLVSKALELSPMQRQQTARTLQTELKQALLALTGATTGSTAAVRAASAGESGKRAGAKNGAANGSSASSAGAGANGSYPKTPKGAGAAASLASGTRGNAALSPETSSGKYAAVGVDGRASKQGAAGRRGAKDLVGVEPGTGKQIAAMAQGRAARQPAAIADRGSAQLPALERTGQQAAVAGRSARQPVAPPDPWTSKQAAAGAMRTGPQPVVSSRGATRQPVLAPRVDYPSSTGVMAAATNVGALALSPSVAGASAASVAVASRTSGARKSGSRAWIRLGDEPLQPLGKWLLAAACLEVLWGATVLALGGLVIATPGRPLPVMQFSLVWVAVVALLSAIGGPALSRPVYRRGTQTKLRRGLQGVALTLYTLVVHAVAIWGAMIFSTTQDATLATIAFMLFGVNVVVVGILSVVNALS